MRNPVIHFEIGGRDAERLTSFYTTLFAWQVQPAGPDYWLVDAGDEGIGGGLARTDDGKPPYLTVYVAVDDLEHTLDQAGELGGKTLMGPTEVPGIGLIALIADPDGNTVGLLRPAARPAEL